MTTRWIAVTGLDGSGKTTLVDNLVKFLESKGFKVYRDRFPHDKYLTKTLLNESKDAYTDRLLFALDNRIAGTHLRSIIETGEYDFIVTQRCFLDSFVMVQFRAIPILGYLNSIMSAIFPSVTLWSTWSQKPASHMRAFAMILMLISSNILNTSANRSKKPGGHMLKLKRITILHSSTLTLAKTSTWTPLRCPLMRSSKR